MIKKGGKLSLFQFLNKKNNTRKNKLISRIKNDDIATKDFFIDLNETFDEKTPSIIAQIKKLSKSFLDNVENIITNIYPNELFIVEVLDESVSVGIISRKWLFLDIKYLKKYTFYELHESYQRIVGKEVLFEQQWYESLENIITIISYETLYSLPKKMVIIDNRYGDFLKITIKKGRFKDKEMLQNLIKKEIEMASGYKEEQFYKQVTQRPTEKNSDKTIFVISLLEKEYFDNLNEYLRESEFVVRRYHSLKSSLYSSFFVGNYQSVMRIHVIGNMAYVMQKYRESGFEYQQVNLELDYSSIELLAYSMDEVIVSRCGTSYEKLKKILAEGNIKLRTFNYHKDLNRCIIRLEKGVSLDTSFALLVGIAYHKLFKINFSALRLGVTRNLSLYEILYNNLNILPFIFLVFTVFVLVAVYTYFEFEYKDLSAKHKDTTELVAQKERLSKVFSTSEANIKKASTRLTNLKKIFEQTQESFDAIVLYELAQNLPDDMILTHIEKKVTTVKKNQISSAIQIKGKCYQERSLLDFINSLHFEGKEVYLISLQDSKKTKFEENESNSIHHDLIEKQLETQENVKDESGEKEESLLDKEKLQEILRMNLEDKKVYFSDTLNNSFILEIK